MNLLQDEMAFRAHHTKKGSSCNSVVCDFFSRLGNCGTCKHYCGVDEVCYPPDSTVGTVPTTKEHYCAKYEGRK